MKTRTSFFISLISLFALLILDQFSKYIIRQTGGFYICNEGISWGIRIPNSLIYILIVSLLFLIVIYLSLILKSKRQNLNEVPNLKSKNFFIWHWDFVRQSADWILLILSGGISNLIDRIYFGCVIDFIDLKFWPASHALLGIAGWPVFNLADIYITIGAIMLIIEMTRNKKEPLK